MAQNDPETPPLDEGIPESDPYPRMILVCIGISVVLATIIFSVLLFDFVLRERDSVRPMRPTIEVTAPGPDSGA